VQRILSILAWFTYQKYFHVKYKPSNLFSIHHLPHTNFCIMKRTSVYSVCILRPTVLIILGGNMSMPVKSGFIQESTKWGSSSPSWTDYRKWWKKLTFLAMSCGCKAQSSCMTKVIANSPFLLIMVFWNCTLLQDVPVMFVVNVLAQLLFCQILFRSTHFNGFTVQMWPSRPNCGCVLCLELVLWEISSGNDSLFSLHTQFV
jgi:hypothetical protein